MTTYAEHIENLTSTVTETALKVDTLSLLAAKIHLAIALNDVPKRDEVQSITVGGDQMSKAGGSACLLTVTGTDGRTYSDFDELFELVDGHVFQGGPGVPSDLLADEKETFDVQALIASIPTLAHELQTGWDALTTSIAAR